MNDNDLDDLTQEHVEDAAEIDATDETDVTDDTAAEETVTAPNTHTQERGKVDIAALHEARAQNRELRDELNRLREFVAPLREQLQEIRQTQAKPPPKEPDPEVDWNDNPKGYIDQKFEKLTQVLQQTREQTGRLDETTQQQEQLRTLTQAIAQDHESFQSKHPDISEAIVFSRQARMAEFRDMGMSEPQARQAINNEELTLAAVALQNGKSPAEVAYQRAQRWGYRPPEGKAPAAGKEDEAASDEARENAQSMGSSGGPSVQDLLDAEEDEFDQFFKDMGFGERMN